MSEETFKILAGAAVGIATLALLLTVAFMVLDEGREEALEQATIFEVVNGSRALTINTTTRLDPNCAAEGTASVTRVLNGTGPQSASSVLLNSGN